MNYLIRVVLGTVLGVSLGVNSNCLASSIDDFIGKTSLESQGDATQTAWVASVLGIDVGEVTLIHKYEDPADNAVVQDWHLESALGADVYSSAFVDPVLTPDYFLIKTGNLLSPYGDGSTYDIVKDEEGEYYGDVPDDSVYDWSSNNTFLFKNNLNLDEAVIDLSQMLWSDVGGFTSAPFGTDVFGKFSHVSVFLTPPVPEPSLLALLVVGLGGLFVKKQRCRRGLF